MLNDTDTKGVVNEPKDLTSNPSKLVDQYMDNIPTGYKKLKEEAKLLSILGNDSRLLSAQRLQRIKKGESFKQEKDKNGKPIYSSFNKFLEAEIPVSRQTIYNYLTLIEIFSVKTFLQQNIDPTKVFPFFPLQKSKALAQPVKNRIMKEAVNYAKNNSARACKEHANKLKQEYLGGASGNNIPALSSTGFEVYMGGKRILSFDDKVISRPLQQKIRDYFQKNKLLMKELYKEISK